MYDGTLFQQRFYEDTKRHTYTISGRRCGRTYAQVLILKAFPWRKVLVPSIRHMDNMISLGVQPSQIILMSELPKPKVDIWIDGIGKGIDNGGSPCA